MNPSLAHSFLVPIDFTEKSLHALEYAAGLLKTQDGIVNVLHVIDDRTEISTETADAIKEKVAVFTREQGERLKINIVPNTVKGNIFISIGETAKRLGTQIIIMGIHGMQGIQFIIGSFAARVILGSPVPVLLTNGSKKFDGFRNIVVPYEKGIVSDYLLHETIELGKLFNSTIHLFSKANSPGFWSKLQEARNLKRMLKAVKGAGLNCQNVQIENKEEGFAESILKYAVNIDADLIMVTTQNKDNTKELVVMETGISLMDRSSTPLYFLNPR